MKYFEACNVRWTEELASIPIVHKGKIIYTKAETGEQAQEKFEDFVLKNNIPVNSVGAFHITKVNKEKSLEI